MTQPPVDPYEPPQEPPQEPPAPYQNPYEPAGQQPGFSPTYGQAAYGYRGTPGHPQPVAPPDHPRSTTAMVLGLVGLIGTFTFCLPVFLGPFAWAIGAKARKEIDANPGQYGGRGQAVAGMVMGIVTTVLLIGCLLLVAMLIVLVATGHLDSASA